jgi:hypothetical protein
VFIAINKSDRIEIAFGDKDRSISTGPDSFFAVVKASPSQSPTECMRRVEVMHSPNTSSLNEMRRSGNDRALFGFAPEARFVNTLYPLAWIE